MAVRPSLGTQANFNPLDVPRRALSIRPAASRPQPPDIVERVRGEFVEMRGFSPTVAQAARLFDLPQEECRQVLGKLVHDGFLSFTRDGRYRVAAR
jgi:hypothetical protein